MKQNANGKVAQISKIVDKNMCGLILYNTKICVLYSNGSLDKIYNSRLGFVGEKYTACTWYSSLYNGQDLLDIQYKSF